MVALATLLVWLLALSIDRDAAYPPSPLLASLVLLPVNLASLWLVSRLLRSGGTTLLELFGFRFDRRLRGEIGWGLVWISVLYLPFVGAIIATMWLLHGRDTFTAFETVFFNPEAASVSSPLWGLILGILAVVTFAPLNAPTEEAIYRGYTQSRLVATQGPLPAILICSVAFGLQHAFFAPSTDAMIVYVVGFTVWGLGSSLIVLKQKRLLPITIAHFIVNFMTSLPAAILPALQLAGVVDA